MPETRSTQSVFAITGGGSLDSLGRLSFKGSGACSVSFAGLAVRARLSMPDPPQLASRIAKAMNDRF
ncbi:MAG: hypothetical protein JST68_22245 [Bacteroidetes bacterium]|nr:hypothetical protein [Bacteroidota bacterium]